MGVVALVEEQKVAQQRAVRQCRRGFGTMACVAHDHRGLELGERSPRGCAILSGSGQGGAECQTARERETHQRQQEQAEDRTLDQG
jgi:hypothetical protein